MADIPASTFKRDMDFGRNRVEPRRYGVWRYGIGRYSASDPTRFAWGRVKPAVLTLLFSLFLAAPAAADTLTPGLNLIKISVDVEDPTRTWGSKEDENKDILDAAICDKRVGCTINGQLIVQTTIQASAIIAESSVTVQAPLTGDGLIGTPIGVDNSSVTLLGPSIGASEVDSDIATQTDLDNIAVSTNALSVSTAALQTVQDALGVSTGTLKTVQDTLSISTASLQTVQDTLGVSTGNLQLVQDTLGVSTNSLQPQVDTLGLSTNTLQLVQNLLGISTNTLQGVQDTLGVSTNTLQIVQDTLGVSTDSLQNQVDALGISAAGWTDDGGVVRLTTPSDVVGLGTSSPGADLEVSKSAGSPVTVAVTNRLFGNEFADAIFISSVASTNDGDPHSRYTVGGGAGEWNAGIHNSDGQKYKISRSRFENEFVITTTGDVGISTGTPQSKLDVNGTVTALEFAGGGSGLTSLDGANLIAASITPGKMANDSVITANILNLNVTEDKLADNAVTAPKVAFNYAGSSSEGGAATTALTLDADPSDCGANTFGTAIATNADLTCSSIADADVPNNITIDLAASATALAVNPTACTNQFVTDTDADGTLICASVTEATVGTGAITITKLADGAVTSDKIASSAVATVKLQDDAVTTSKLADDSVTRNKIAADSCTNGQILKINAGGAWECAADAGTGGVGESDNPTWTGQHVWKDSATYDGAVIFNTHASSSGVILDFFNTNVNNLGLCVTNSSRTMTTNGVSKILAWYTGTAEHDLTGHDFLLGVLVDGDFVGRQSTNIGVTGASNGTSPGVHQNASFTYVFDAPTGGGSHDFCLTFAAKIGGSVQLCLTGAQGEDFDCQFGVRELMQ